MKTILITGASSGFGAACATRFARAGHRLILLARRQERLQQLAEMLSPAPVHIVPIDIRDYPGIKQAMNDLPIEFKDIDVCINNAGLALGKDPAYQVAIEDWDTVVDTNIKGLLYCTHLVLPGMLARNSGHIVNVGSIAGELPYPGSNVYGASKAFVKLFSQNLKADLLGSPIRVSNIEPGLAETEFSQVRFKGDKAKAKSVYAGTKPILPEDIAEMIDWVISLPAHLNINSLEVMPVCQAYGDTAIVRDSSE